MALVKHMIFGWKIMAAVKIVTDWIFLFGFSFIQCHVTSFPYLDCALNHYQLHVLKFIFHIWIVHEVEVCRILNDCVDLVFTVFWTSG